jgi:hypothetical protein
LKPECRRRQIVVRAPPTRRGFGNACRNVIPRKAGHALPSVMVLRQRIIARTIFKIAGGPNSIDEIGDVRQPT